MLIVQALITALLSGLFSGGVLFALSERRDRAETRLRYLEELFSSFDGWCSAIEAFHKQAWDAAFPTYDYYQFETEAKELKKAVDGLYARTKFLLAVWAPDLGKSTAPILELDRQLIGLKAQALTKRVKTDTLAAEDLVYLNDPLVELHRLRVDSLSRISAKARAIADRPYVLQLRKR